MAEFSSKVLEYERFVNEKLKEDLRLILEQRDKSYGQIAEYLQLKTTIEKIKESKQTEGLKTKVDIGCNFYVQANIPDSSRIYVFIGFGFFLEMTLDEALKFIGKRTKLLNEHTDRLTDDAAKVKANIRLVLEGLRELQQINNEPETQRREIF
ncbi:protein UXT-like [Mercenaria mercenaria]|uniref:protein UXT-like n=1 Tax=Mercenaria mercenaria TaxID=6596 RepID=UPI001E1DAF1C|nr:protein UXT-like [Mercenaria mercenaria]